MLQPIETFSISKQSTINIYKIDGQYVVLCSQIASCVGYSDNTHVGHNTLIKTVIKELNIKLMKISLARNNAGKKSAFIRVKDIPKLLTTLRDRMQNSRKTFRQLYTEVFLPKLEVLITAMKDEIVPYVNLLIEEDAQKEALLQKFDNTVFELQPQHLLPEQPTDEIARLKGRIAQLESKFKQNYREIFVENFRLARKRRNLSLVQLAKKIGKATNRLEKISSGKNMENIFTFCEIADALEVSLDWLFGRNIAQNAAKTERE